MNFHVVGAPVLYDAIDDRRSGSLACGQAGVGFTR